MISSQLFNFFKEEIIYSEKRQNIKIDKGIELYLVKLMLDRVLESGDSKAYLVDIYQNSVSAKNKKEAFSSFKRLGDVSLFNGGYLYDNIYSKTDNLSYYIDMGQNGYHNAGRISNENIYFSLSDEYKKCLCILNFISENKKKHSKRDLQRLYQFYLDTSSPGNKEFLANLKMLTQEINE